MRNILYLCFCIVLAVGVGCAITDYETILDNDQISPKSGSGSGSKAPKVSKKICNQCIVDTKGKAHIDESSQVAFSDGSGGWDETLWMVDQKKDGSRKMITYNNHSDSSGPTFHDDLYCDTSFNGCAIWVATDPPGELGNAAFDGTADVNCRGFSSLSFLTSTSRYYGECGKAKFDLASRLQMANLGIYGNAFGMEGLFYTFDYANTTITLDNTEGFITTLPMTANVVAFAGPSGDGRAVADFSDPSLSRLARTYADFVGTHATQETLMTVTYNGVSGTWAVGGNVGPSTADRIRRNALMK
jgi:hypothetical protein